MPKSIRAAEQYVTKIFNVRDKNVQCLVDVNECSTSAANNCSSNADCENKPGSFECNCRAGYTEDGVNCSGRFLKPLFVSCHSVSLEL